MIKPISCKALSLAVACQSVSACAYIETRPGHPESWKESSYYNPRERWDTSIAKPSPAIAGSGTPVYLIAKTPKEIWQARGYAYNMHLQFQAAAFKAQDVQDQLAIPVFGLAVATVATGIAHASTVAIAGVGLGGAAAGGGLSYLHPDKDAITDQTANTALLCVVDQSKILNDMTAIPLVLDRAALQDALSKLRLDSGSLLTGATSNQQAKSAVQSVESAAETSIKALDSAISQYGELPTDIYQTVDNINTAAQAAGNRTLDYTSLLQTLQKSATNQSTTDQAKSQVQQATQAAAAAANSGGAAATVTASKSQPAPPTTLASTASEVAKTTADNPIPAVSGAAATAAGTPATDSSTKKATLSAILGSITIGDMTRVNLLSKAALDDIPNPNFAAIDANIKACNLPKAN